MTIDTTRTPGAHRADRPGGYPNDYLHSDRSYAQSQRDIGGGLFLGAVTVIALMALIVTGLLF